MFEVSDFVRPFELAPTYLTAALCNPLPIAAAALSPSCRLTLSSAPLPLAPSPSRALALAAPPLLAALGLLRVVIAGKGTIPPAATATAVPLMPAAATTYTTIPSSEVTPPSGRSGTSALTPVDSEVTATAAATAAPMACSTPSGKVVIQDAWAAAKAPSVCVCSGGGLVCCC